MPVALHIDFALRDQRLPRDLGLFYQRVPLLWAALHGTGRAGAWKLLGGTGGWYELALAGWLSLTGRSAQAFMLVDAGWLLALLWLCGQAAAALAGKERARAAALSAVLLAAGTPVLILRARVSWLHLPEAVLVLAAAVPWLRDPTLERGSVRMALFGALALLLRPSALAWLVPLGLALALGRPPRRRLLAVGGTWLLAALPALWSLPGYLAPKLAGRERYALDVPGLAAQFMPTMGPLLPAVALIGLVLAPRRLRGRFLLAWVLLPALLWLAFRAGLDNFLVGPAALAILAGAGLSILAAPRLGAGGPPLLAVAPAPPAPYGGARQWTWPRTGRPGRARHRRHPPGLPPRDHLGPSRTG